MNRVNATSAVADIPATRAKKRGGKQRGGKKKVESKA
jgi:hypothetical protein